MADGNGEKAKGAKGKTKTFSLARQDREWLQSNATAREQLMERLQSHNDAFQEVVGNICKAFGVDREAEGTRFSRDFSTLIVAEHEARDGDKGAQAKAAPTEKPAEATNPEVVEAPKPEPVKA